MIARMAVCPFLVRRDDTREVNTDDHKRTHQPAWLPHVPAAENYYPDEQRGNHVYSRHCAPPDYLPSRSRMYSATSSRSAPTTSGRSTSGSSTIPGRATNAAAQPTRKPPPISQSYSSTILTSRPPAPISSAAG